MSRKLHGEGTGPDIRFERPQGLLDDRLFQLKSRHFGDYPLWVRSYTPRIFNAVDLDSPPNSLTPA
jgi:hypothetical protein